MKAKTRFSRKDQLFNPEKVAYLAGLLSTAWPAFPTQAFQRAIISRLPELGLKQCITHITHSLKASLPAEYPQALAIILCALPEELSPDKNDHDFGDFIFAPCSHFVVLYGCEKNHLSLSLQALRAITKRFSAEDAIRYFINAYPKESLAFLQQCSQDPHYHVRRLASEGMRPRLPWSKNLLIDYSMAWPILDQLHADPTRYVTRSVANHLNDISKIDPAAVLQRLQQWRKQQQPAHSELDYITGHALRTLVKRGHGEALQLLGFSSTPAIGPVRLSTSTPRVTIGEPFEFSVRFLSQSRQKLLIDYVMYFAQLKQHNLPQKQKQKIFKLKQIDAAAQQTITLNKVHPMRLMTTRSLKPGEHRISLQINGQTLGSVAFELLAP